MHCEVAAAARLAAAAVLHAMLSQQQGHTAILLLQMLCSRAPAAATSSTAHMLMQRAARHSSHCPCTRPAPTAAKPPGWLSSSWQAGAAQLPHHRPLRTARQSSQPARTRPQALALPRSRWARHQSRRPPQSRRPQAQQGRCHPSCPLLLRERAVQMQR